MCMAFFSDSCNFPLQIFNRNEDEINHLKFGKIIFLKKGLQNILIKEKDQFCMFIVKHQ